MFWTLAQFGYQAQLADLQKQLAKGEISPDHDWYVTRTNLHAMTSSGQREFLDGLARFRDRPVQWRENELHESQYKVKIDRAFAIAAQK